ncbi:MULTISPECIES: hypothetical protein [Bacillus cereus group]|uniref:YkzH n=1 Tax=Bacillus cytotoxicus TaxID=580165 RepID=A0AAX2CHR9_9BACI|nr:MULTISPECIES: hypothetical protein [Bacillus cereus group]AWC29012.1 hypothetical protein CG483_012155 [Bacillus cytotoxicus]AWC39602.1 hypothetical protein CG480_003095 [Bacillus cytotoxicus]AWC47533.1 hypothetical protein CG478_003095 [Bacillus cytotoxicus]AWC53083.1 hypothetical protein CG477_012115 [Bacillus cytotoxicus]AWC57212.1 hypothetical protein CG476_012140 [Bacillus cytotoxicus]
MHPYQDSHLHYPIRNNHPSSNIQYLIQQMTRFENRLDHLIKLIEDSNQLLRSIEQQKQIISNGGGSVIIRM